MEEEIWRDFKRSGYFLGRAIFGILGGGWLGHNRYIRDDDDEDDSDEAARRRKRFLMIAIPIGVMLLVRAMSRRRRWD